MKTDSIKLTPLSTFVESCAKSIFKDSDFQNLQELFTTKSWPPVNIHKGEKGFVLELLVPGYEKDQIEVSVENDIISIETKKQESTTNYVRKEFSLNYCKRSFSIPEKCNTNLITTVVKNGVLTIDIPLKMEEEKKPEKKIIPVS